jgi:hypothetical protein
VADLRLRSRRRCGKVVERHLIAILLRSLERCSTIVEAWGKGIVARINRGNWVIDVIDDVVCVDGNIVLAVKTALDVLVVDMARTALEVLLMVMARVTLDALHLCQVGTARAALDALFVVMIRAAPVVPVIDIATTAGIARIVVLVELNPTIGVVLIEAAIDGRGVSVEISRNTLSSTIVYAGVLRHVDDVERATEKWLEYAKLRGLESRVKACAKQADLFADLASLRDVALYVCEARTR